MTPPPSPRSAAFHAAFFRAFTDAWVFPSELAGRFALGVFAFETGERGGPRVTVDVRRLSDGETFAGGYEYPADVPGEAAADEAGRYAAEHLGRSLRRCLEGTGELPDDGADNVDSTPRPRNSADALTWVPPGTLPGPGRE